MKKQLLILLLLLSSAIVQATTYYISSSGSDSNNGTSIATPFKTIDKINSLVLVSGDQVLFKRGESFSGTLSLTESGTSGNVITFGAYGTGDNPEITGFTTVALWTNLGSNIWESTNTVSTLSNCNMVTIGSVNTAMGRTPNEGNYYTFQSHSGSTSITSSNLTGTPNWTGAEAVMRMGQFKWDRRVITSQSASTINWTTATSYTPKDNFGFFIQNDERTLDVQNEWYYNPTTQKIRVYSTSQPTNFKLSTIDNLCNISASYIKIENISFTGANSYAIWGDVFGTVRSNVTIQNCSFNFIGITSIYGLKCNSYLIDNNSFNNCNNKAIQLGYATGITVSNNTINNTAVYEGMATGMWSSIHAISATDLIIEYNRIINSGFSGICYGSGVNNIIRYNYIDGFCKKLDDGGGIYGGTNGVVSNNVIVNGFGFPETTDLSFPTIAAGIYHDAGSANIVVTNNSVGNCSYAGIFCNGNVNMVVEDNTVYNSSTYQLRLTAWNDKDYTVNRNKFVCRDASQMAMFINSGANDIPSKYTGNNNYFASPIGTTNLFYVEQPSNSSDWLYTLAEWKVFSGHDANSLGSPQTVSSVNDIYFYYNPTKNDSTVVLLQPGLDVTGQAYASPITLAPYSSIVILRDSSTGTYYYVSSSTGSDGNAGTQALPWASLTKVNSATLAAKDRVLFKSGDSWYGQLVPKSGSALGDIIYSSYGTGNKPLIHASSIITGASNWTNYLGNIWKNAEPTLNNTELLVNADDANNFSSVLYQANSPAVGTKTIDTGTYHSGTSSIKIACTGTGNVPNSMYLQYTSSFAMSSGKSYEFSFWTYGTSSGQIDEAWALTTSWGEIDKLQSAKTFSATTWTKMTYRFTAQNDYTACMFLVRFGLGVTSGNSIYFDDFSFKEITGFYPNIEICSLIFNNDRSFGKRKWSIGTLTSQGDWYWDGTNKILYLYSSGSPSGLYQHIRAVNKLNLISASSKSYITIDGLALKYGDYGFVGSGTDHITIKNCDVAYIGGSDAGSPVRKGNGIEFWASNSNVLLQGNKVWECFDAGISHQSSVASTVMNNITFKNNQVWNCEYGYEYFNTGSGSSTSNILIENNTFYNSGGGWGHSQRNDPSGYSIRLANRTEATHSNFIIRNNILSNSTAECQHNWDTTYNLYTINNNLYYQPSGNIVGINFTYYYNQAQFSTYKSATGWDANSLTGSPKFIGKDVGDFRLLPTSPARKIGYQGVDIGALPYTIPSKTIIKNGKIYAL